MATATPTRPQISTGPGLFDIMLSLFGKKELRFKLGDTFLNAVVIAARAEDQSRNTWILTVILPNHASGQRLWYYNCHDRTGRELKTVGVLPLLTKQAKRTTVRTLATLPTQLALLSALHDGTPLGLAFTDGTCSVVTVQGLLAENGDRKAWFVTAANAGNKPVRLYCNSISSRGYEFTITA